MSPGKKEKPVWLLALCQRPVQANWLQTSFPHTIGENNPSGSRRESSVSDCYIIVAARAKFTMSRVVTTKPNRQLYSRQYGFMYHKGINRICVDCRGEIVAMHQ